MIKYIRKLQKASTNSYVITIPKELIEKFHWRERQKLEIVYDGKTAKLTIKDWRKK
ncbi:MAG TPA: AbrB/MazE/SpoVT family DNA-binding domain-containing protein [bacterium]|nr:AbrB/MazE/SpoVT family DNA-binding domain-containing protein [bacterium]HPW39794.1 AbrB/MazE/SpoVT family DNA-binding domain-containing protein [bacterium]